MSGQQDMDGNKPASEATESEAITPEAQNGEATGQTAAHEAGTTGTSDPATAAEIERAALESQVRDLTDRLLRAHAEMDNMRKRSEREKSDISKYAITKFALDMVAINDNLVRAMDAAGAPDTHTAEVKGLYEGVALTAQELGKALHRHGVVRIETEGRIFDPHLHQAMMEQPDPSVPSGTILQVFQDGFMVGDRVLRPAMVVVARGGMKPKPEGGESPGTPQQAEQAERAEPPAEDASTEAQHPGPTDPPAS